MTYGIKSGKKGRTGKIYVHRDKYNENFKVRRIKAMTPKGYDGEYKIEKTENGEYIAKFYKKEKKNENKN